jgi:hypothetical protein
MTRCLGPSQVGEGDGIEQACVEIVSTHIKHSGVKRRCGLLLGLVLFWLVALPIQLGVVGPYLVRGVWFPSRLPLEETGRTQNFGP